MRDRTSKGSVVLTIRIDCKNVVDAKNILYEITRQPETVGFSPEYLKRLGATFTIYANYAALRNSGTKAKRTTLILDIDVMFDKKMSLVEFLKNNPAIRDVSLVKMYFSEEVLQHAIEIGAINIKRGKVVV